MPSLPFCVLPTPLGTVTAGNEAAAHPASHLGEFDSIGMTWQSSDGAGNHWVRGNFGSAKEVDFAALIAASVTPGAWVYRLRLGSSQAAVDGSSPGYDSGFLPLVSPLITVADGLYHSHLELPSVQTFQWWRIDLQGQSIFEAAAIVLGKKVTPANFYSPGWQRGIEDLGGLEVGRYGIADETPGRIFRRLAFTLGWQSEADFETKFQPLVRALGKRRPALWCFDPAATVYRQSKTYMGWLQNSFIAQHSADTPAGVRYTQDFEIFSMI